MELLNELTINMNLEEKEELKDRLELKEIEVRICSKCSKFMNTGFVMFDGEDYYCSDECLNKEVGEKEWNKLTAYLINEEVKTEEEKRWTKMYGDTGCYYTEWI